ncbi:MAG: Ig-like domain repeat protein, partial [Methanobrevibacter sp.]|nr:Ig-like domain repeat protein [Methanobrevibacter sp.]
KDNVALTTGGAISIEASSVTVNESNFYNNNANRGGALFVGGEGTDNYIYSSIFEGNIANGTGNMDGLGGAIDWVASSGYIYDTNFTSNFGDYGGGIYFGGKSDKSVIDNCIFDDNQAKYNGGAIDCNASSMYLTNTIFDGNIAQFGAALCRETNAKSGSGENNTFKNNHAIVVGAALGWMGSIGIKITNYTFINNSADVAGGAIYVSPDSHNCSIIDCVFEDNYVTNKTNGWVGGERFIWTAWDNKSMYYLSEWTSNSSIATTFEVLADGTIFYYTTEEQLDNALGNGGAITIYGANATIVDTSFTGNTARFGGAVYVGAMSGHTNINRTVFSSNVASESGGAVNLHASGVHIDVGEFYDNVAKNGSALYVGGIGTENKVHESIFEGNNATEYGGGIYWIAYEGEIINSSFARNIAEYGGGIYLNGRSGNTNITNTTFRSNNATKNGGAIECNASNIGIYNLTFENNYAGEYGAALCREYGATRGHGTNNTFISNHAGISGAALAWMGVKNIHIVDYTFIDNTAETSGGAIYVALGSDNCIIENSTFEGNHLTNLSEYHYGGAIDCVADNMTVKMSLFKDNGANTGGAIYVGAGSKLVTIQYSDFVQNYATANGGAIGLKADNLDIDTVYFKSNTAEESGGALYAGGTGKSNSIMDSVFVDNTAGDHGGAIDWLAQAGEFINTNFTRNSAVYGGAIYLNGVSSNSTLENITFRENRATKNGGAIDCNASMMGLSNTQFISNYAGEYGAALCREANATGGFGGDNTFISNHADIAGAALAWLGVDGITINNYTFINNTANMNGGAIYVREDSPNCKVLNSHFELNYVTDILSGRGGSIDWLGANGQIYNSTFNYSYALVGGTLYVASDNMNISKSNFSYSISLQRGGVIAGNNVRNATIDDCIILNSISAGYISTDGSDFGQGGAISWDNSDNVTISNTQINGTESHADGAVFFMNCNNSGLYNVTINHAITMRNGGSISWSNSTNITIDLCDFIDTTASYHGGSLYLNNVDNVTVKNSYFNTTSALWGNGGAIYVNGNATFDNNTYDEYSAFLDYAGGIFVYAGNSTISNSTFIGPDVIRVNVTGTAFVYHNNVTGKLPNKHINYLNESYDARYNKYDYSVWNDGNLYLDNNTFDYIIFNNGTIWTNTTTWLIDGGEYNETWNTSFTFFANITDDNNNTIISVDTLDTWNDVGVGEVHYLMPYNALPNTRLIYQGNFTLSASDIGLKKNKVIDGILNVRVPTELSITRSEEYHEDIEFSVKITAKTQSNYTFDTSKLIIKINGEIVDPSEINFFGDLSDWTVVYANFTRNHMRVGEYTITAEYLGDDFHEAAVNETDLALFSRPFWIKVHAEDIFYGQTLVINVTSNATNTENGRITISINGKEMSVPLHLNPDGSYIYEIPNENYTAVLEPGNHIVSVIFQGGTYYEVETNFSTFTVFKLDTAIDVNVTNITFGENEIIDVSVNKTADGFIAVRIGNQIYSAYIVNGTSQFNISGLATGNYTARVTFYPTDNHFNGNAVNVTFRVDPTSNFDIDVKVDSIQFGQNATVRVLVATDAVGNVTISIDGIIIETVNLTNGVAVLENVSGLAGGQHAVNVTYNGDSRYSAKDKNGTTFMVNPTNDWEMRITGDYQPYGENTKITITPNRVLLGENVTIIIDDVPYVVNFINGVATLTLNNLSAGGHVASVTYDGDVNYASKSSNFFPQIPKATPTITLTQNGKDVIATVSGNTTGNVTFYIGDKVYTENLDGRTATLVGKLDYGTNVVSAIYNGDDNYTTAQARDNFFVERLDSLVNVTVNNTVYGDTVEILVQVGEGQTGSVKITINDNTYMDELDNGEAKFYINGLNVKEYTVDVTYNGDDVFLPNDNSTKFNVTKANLTVDVTALNMTVADDITFIINSINNDFTGNVAINVTDAVKYDDVVKTLIELGKLPVADKYSANVTFYGDNNYNNNTLTVNFTISRVTPSIDVEIVDVTYPNSAVANINVANDATGTVNITIGTQVFEGTVTNGVGSVDLTGLSAGVKEAYVEFFTTDSYNNNVTAYARFTINKASSSIEIVVNDIYKVGQDIIITLNPVNSTGAVTVTVNGESKPVEDNTVTIAGGLDEGTYTIVANLSSTSNYDASSNTKVFSVIKNDIAINLEDISETIYVDSPVTFTANLNESVTGDVIFNINGANYTVHVSDDDVATYTYTPVNNATLTVIATFTGNDKYNSNSSDSKQFTVVKVSSAVDLSDVTIEVGETAKIVITVTDGATGSVNVTVNGETQTVGLVDSKAIVYVFDLVNDTYDITVKYLGDDKYDESENTTQKLFVNKVESFDFTVIVSDAKVGENTTVTVIVPGDADGNITIGDKTAKVENGQAVIVLDKEQHAGAKDVTVTYGNDSKYADITDGVVKDYVVDKANSNVSISVESIYTIGDTVVITLTSVNGTAAVKINDVTYTVVDNQVTFTANATGNYEVVASVGESEDYYGSDATAVFDIVKASSGITIDVEDVYKVGEDIVITLSPTNSTGAVTVTIDGKPYTVTDNQVTIADGLANGTYTIVANLAADAKYGSAYNSTTFEVIKNDITISVDDISETIYVDGPVTFTANLNESVTGDVVFNINGINYTVSISNSDVATYTYTPLNNATLTVVATFVGNDKFNSNSSASKQFNVNKVASSITLEDVVINVGETAEIEITVTGGATGSINVTVNGETQTVSLVNSKATVYVSGLANDTYPITVKYLGDDKYDASENDDYNVIVNKVADYDIVVVANDMFVGETQSIVVILPDDVEIADNIVIEINGVSYTYTISNNVVYVDYEATVIGTFEINVTYAGDAKYQSGDKNGTEFTVYSSSVYDIIIDVDAQSYGKDTVISVKVPKGVSNNVTITVDGNSYSRKADVDGIALLTLNNLSAGSHKVTATYPGDEAFSEKSNSTSFYVEKAQSTIKINVTPEVIYVGESALITVNVSCTGDVIVYVDGKAYLRTLNNNIVTVTVDNLEYGTHSIIAYYAGDENYTGSNAFDSFEVVKLNSTLELEVDNIDVGESEIINITLGDITAVILVDVNNKGYYVNITNGHGQLVLDDLKAEEYKVTVKFSGDDTYNANTTSSSFIVSKVKDYDLDVDIAYGDNGAVILDVTLPDDATGELNITVDGKSTIVPVTNGTISIPGLEPGNHNINVTYLGDDKYDKKSDINTADVPKWDNYSLHISTDDITYGDGETITVTLPGDATGKVNITVDGKLKEVTIKDGKAVLTLDDLSAGEHTVDVAYESAKYAFKSNSTKFNVDKSSEFEMDVEVADNNAVITLPDDATGNVTIMIDGEKYTVADVTGASTSVPLPELGPGNHTIEVIYSGDDNYNSKTAETSLEVPKVDEFTMNVSAAVDGRDVTISVELPENATGLVLVDIGGTGYYANVTDGKASVTIKDMANGDYDAVVTYMGDDYYAAKDNSTEFTVEAKVTPVMNVTVDVAENSTDAVVNVELPEDATGNVTVVVDGKVYNVTDVSGGLASIELNDLTPGNHTVEVIYSGNDDYTSTSNYNVVEIPKITDYEFDLSAFDIKYGDNTNITVRLPDDVNGVVLIDLDGIGYYVNITNGVGSLELPIDLAPGEYDVTATYKGNDKYASKVASDSFKVINSKTDMTVEVKDGKVIVELPEDATGNVKLTIDGKDYTVPVENGKAVMDIPDLEPGNYDVVANYPGDDKYSPVTNSTSFNVPKISDYPIDVAQDGDELVITVPEDTTGNVVVNIGGKDYTVPIENGVAKLDISDLPAGDYKAKVTYPGNDKYTSKTVNADVTVARSLVITAPDVVKYYSGPERFVIYTKDNDGNNVDNITLTITINGVSYTRVTSDGQTSLPLNLQCGNYSVKVEFAGNEEFKAQSIESQVEILHTIYANDVLKVYRNATQYHALFTDGQGNPLVGVDVTFNINGVFYHRTTDADGWAQLNLNLEAGTYILTAYNPVTGEERANLVTVFNLIDSSDLVKHYRNDSQFVVRLRALDGSWAKAGEEVTFNINGVFYTRYSNETGHVQLNINLQPGEYVITTMYKYAVAGNTVKVLPRLITSDLTMVRGDGSVFTAKTLDEKGNLAPHQQVSFNVYGIVYDVTTDNNGEAKIHINLPSGEYLITSQ